jgi:hypothetical protein
MADDVRNNVTLRRVRVTIVGVETQQVLHILSVCFWLLLPSVNCACAILSSVACPALPYFSTLSHKRHDFRKEKVTEYKKPVVSFSTIFSETFLILRRSERDMVINVPTSSSKVPVILVRF